MPLAWASRPASQFAPVSDSTLPVSPPAAVATAMALLPSGRCNDWCRCQPLAMACGSGGRHTKLAW